MQAQLFNAYNFQHCIFYVFSVSVFKTLGRDCMQCFLYKVCRVWKLAFLLRPSYHPSTKLIGQSNIELWHILPVFVTWPCKLDLWPLTFRYDSHVTWCQLCHCDQLNVRFEVHITSRSIVSTTSLQYIQCCIAHWLPGQSRLLRLKGVKFSIEDSWLLN